MYPHLLGPPEDPARQPGSWCWWEDGTVLVIIIIIYYYYYFYGISNGKLIIILPPPPPYLLSFISSLVTLKASCVRFVHPCSPRYCTRAPGSARSAPILSMSPMVVRWVIKVSRDASRLVVLSGFCWKGRVEIFD